MSYKEYNAALYTRSPDSEEYTIFKLLGLDMGVQKVIVAGLSQDDLRGFKIVSYVKMSGRLPTEIMVGECPRFPWLKALVKPHGKGNLKGHYMLSVFPESIFSAADAAVIWRDQYNIGFKSGSLFDGVPALAAMPCRAFAWCVEASAVTMNGAHAGQDMGWRTVSLHSTWHSAMDASLVWFKEHYGSQDVRITRFWLDDTDQFSNTIEVLLYHPGMGDNGWRSEIRWATTREAWKMAVIRAKEIGAIVEEG